MRKSKFTDEQIAYALHQAESGTAVLEICRKLGISEQTFYRWKKRYGGLGVSELRELKQLQELSLTRTQVTDAGLVHLRALKQLQRLSLDGAQVTDAGDRHERHQPRQAERQPTAARLRGFVGGR